MNNPNEKVEAIFEAALALKTDVERAEYLARACPDPALRREVESLLAAHRHPDSVFEDETITLAVPLSEHAGMRIGRYKLLQQIGEGGMGVVYMAEQEEPVRRRVALKIIKLGMDTRQVVARFEAERQALALMDHPNIAKVLDGGATETGRPYFVMELVQGVPITEYCDRAKVSAQGRLKLFVQVCQAVQHAHQKGIIHRDIKPSNVMVTLHDGVPVPMVIDFGIAKATNQKLTEKTLFTDFGAMIGTPAYRSPEQAEMSGLDIDTRTDIYALGVLLYAMLTGTTPFTEKRLRSLGYGEMQRVILEEEPERPSTRLSTMANEQKTLVARNCGEDLASLNHLLQGDLDWIVMKCLEKDRQRRYETANGLAHDIQRHLSNEPVEARPPSAVYRFQKLVRRNKLEFAVGVVVAIGLLMGLVVLSFALARERALKSESARADSIATFVTGMLNDAVPQMSQQGNNKGIRVLLESADRLVSTTLTNSPAAELNLRSTLQSLYNGPLEDTKSARKHADHIESLLSRVPDDRLPPGSRDGLRVGIAMARLWDGDVTRGRAELEKLAEDFKKRGPEANDLHASTLIFLGMSFQGASEPSKATALFAEAYRLDPRGIGEGYAQALILDGKYPLAEEVARTNIVRVNSGRGDSPQDVVSYYSLVEILCRLGRFQEAQKLLEEQLGPRPARPWAPGQVRGFRMLQLAVQAFSGDWRAAGPGLIAQATDSLADASEWMRGVSAALATGDTNAYLSLGRVGLVRFVGNAEAATAHLLFLGLILRPQEEDLSITLPELLRRVEEGKDYHWSAANIPFLHSQLAYRTGAYEEALHSLDAWIQSKENRPYNAIMLPTMKTSALPDFWRAMALVRLSRAEEAMKAYSEGAKKLRAGFPGGIDFPGSMATFYASHALRQEAQKLLRSQGIAVPDAGTTP